MRGFAVKLTAYTWVIYSFMHIISTSKADSFWIPNRFRVNLNKNYVRVKF